jgi:hypothetical protein
VPPLVEVEEALLMESICRISKQGNSDSDNDNNNNQKKKKKKKKGT